MGGRAEHSDSMSIIGTWELYELICCFGFGWYFFHLSQHLGIVFFYGKRNRKGSR